MIPSLQRDLSFGDQVGRYRLIAELARGGMGIVYLAATRGPAGFNKLVALKQLRPDLVEDSGFLTMFLDEARVAARLSHPNIVQTNDVEQSDGRYFIAMEYLDGRSFGQIQKRYAKKGGFPLHLSLLVLRDVLSGLDYAHAFKVDGNSFGVVHRDISPQNIFVTFEGCAKIIDFGIAKAHDSIVETKAGVLKGKTHYMAPEQLSQRAETRSDLFAMGAVLFEVLTGRRLWARMSEMEVMAHLLRGDIPEVPATLPNVPAVLLQICRTALSARVEDRFASAATMRDAIDEYLWNARVTPQCREVGAQLMEEFGAEREGTRAAVDAYLATGMDGPVRSLLPLEPCGVAESPSSANRRYLHSQPRAAVEGSVSAVLPSADGLASGLAMASGLPLPVEPRASAAWKLAAMGAVALMLVGIIIGMTFRGGSTVHVAPPPVAIAVSPPKDHRASAPPPVTMIAFSVSVSPSTAQVLIDGQPMPSNPFLGRFPKDYAAHRVRATAAGFLSKERVVSFTDNVMVDFSLDPKVTPVAILPPGQRHRDVLVKRKPGVATQPPAQEVAQAVRVVPPPAAPAAAAAPRPTSPYDITPRRSADPVVRRAIDSSNPYGEDQ